MPMTVGTWYKVVPPVDPPAGTPNPANQSARMAEAWPEPSSRGFRTNVGFRTSLFACALDGVRELLPMMDRLLELHQRFSTADDRGSEVGQLVAIDLLAFLAVTPKQLWDSHLAANYKTEAQRIAFLGKLLETFKAIHDDGFPKTWPNVQLIVDSIILNVMNWIKPVMESYVLRFTDSEAEGGLACLTEKSWLRLIFPVSLPQPACLPACLPVRHLTRSPRYVFVLFFSLFQAIPPRRVVPGASLARLLSSGRERPLCPPAATRAAAVVAAAARAPGRAGQPRDCRRHSAAHLVRGSVPRSASVLAPCHAGSTVPGPFILGWP